MGCIIKHKGQSIPEAQFLSFLNGQIEASRSAIQVIPATSLSSKFVSPGVVKTIFHDAFQEIKESGRMHEANVDIVFDAIRNMLNKSYLDTYTKDAIYSVLLEFGNEVRFVNGIKDNYNIQGDMLEQTGMLHILKNLEKLDQLSKDKTAVFSQRKAEYENFFSGLMKTFGSTTVDRVGVVDAQKQKVDIKTNSGQAIERSIIEPLISEAVLDKEGLVNTKITNQLKGIRNGGNFDVTDSGFSYKSNIRGGARTSTYSLTRNISDITAAEMRAIFSMIGLKGININVFSNIIRRGERQRSYPVHGLIHRMLVISRINSLLSEGITSEINRLRELPTEEAHTAFGTDLFQVAVNNLNADNRKLFDYMVSKIYNGSYSETTGQFTPNQFPFKTLVDAEFTIGDSNYHQQMYLPNPLDIFTDFELLSSILNEAKAVIPSNATKTPQQNTIYMLRKSAAVDEMFFGSSNYVRKVQIDLRTAEVNNPLVIKQKNEDTKSEEIIGYNSPILNNRIAFGKSYYIIGARHGKKERDFNNFTRQDIYITMIETLLAKEISHKKAYPKYNILMTSLAEQSRGLVVPFSFPKRAGTESFFLPTLERGRLKNLDINKRLVVDSTNDIVNYYEARQNKTLEVLKEVMGETSIDVVRQKAIDGTVINIPADKVREVRQKLVVGRDYVLVTENKTGEYTIDIKYGAAAHMKGVMFDHTFRANWKAIKEEGLKQNKDSMSIAFDQYDLLKGAMAGEFKLFARDLLDSGAYEHFLRPDSSFPDGYLSDLDPAFIKAIEEHYARIENLKNDWLQKDQETQSQTDLKGVQTFNELFAKHPEQANAIYVRMMHDSVLQEEIAAIQKKGRELKKEDRIKALNIAAGLQPVAKEEAAQETINEQQWPPLLEGVFMLHWLANEGIGTLVRGDITNYANITDFVKRGHGFKAPGSSFDINNSGGLGMTLNFAVMEDIPGFNLLFGVNPGDKGGRKLFTDGNIIANPITQIHMFRSHGGNFGNINDNVNKTLLFGRDHAKDRVFYYKMAMAPVIEEMYRNSLFYRNVFNRMLGTYATQFENFYSQTRNFVQALNLMADWTTDPTNAEDGVLPRDKMIHFLVHESAIKNNATSINGYTYSDPDPKMWGASNVVAPDITVIEQVPTSFLSLQNINNADGNSSLHSFATQLFSTIGVNSHNAPYYNAIQNALAQKTQVITDEINTALAAYDTDGNIENLKSFFYDKIKKVTGKSIINTRFEALLNENADPNTFKKKLVETFVSYLNSHLKPRVPGHNAPQQPLMINIYKSTKDNGIYLANDIGLRDDSVEQDGFERRLLKPLSFYNPQGAEFTSKQELSNAVRNSRNPKQDVIVTPAEVIMRFPHLRKFGLNENSTLASVMSVLTPEGVTSLYENGFQRSAGLGAINGKASGLNILAVTQAKTVGELLNSIVDRSVKRRIRNYIWGLAAKDLDALNAFGNTEAGTRLSKEEISSIIQLEFNSLLQDSLSKTEEAEAGPYSERIIDFIGSYFFDLNNALDVLTVRIPTTGAASASAGRIVAFSNSAGNTIFTSSEKSILDGSDYDYDELHVFYHKFKGIKINREDFENVILDNILNFYKDSRNFETLLMSIDLSTMRERANKNEEIGEKPKIIHSIPSYIEVLDSFFAGEDLVGHFANQMRYTNSLMSLADNIKGRSVNSSLRNIFSYRSETDQNIVEKLNNYLEVMNVVNTLVNAATDNPNEGGMLGKLNIKGAVANMILGMITAKQITDAATLETLILDELDSEILREAVKLVVTSRNLTYPNRTTLLYEALEQISEEQPAKSEKALQLQEYAYIGEQVNRLGAILGLIQEVPGLEYDYHNKLQQIHLALGQDLGSFLEAANLENAKNLDIRNTILYKEDVKGQITYLNNEYYNKKEKTRHAKHEPKIRGYVNIKGIAANDPYLLAQLRAVHAFNQLKSKLFFVDKHPQLQKKVLTESGKTRVIYEQEYKDLMNAFDKVLIGSYFSNTNHVVNLRYFPVEGSVDNSMVEKSFNLREPKDIIRFVNAMPDYVQYLKGLYPENSFLKRIDIELIPGNPFRILNFRNSSHIAPTERLFNKLDFQHLASIDNDAANAFRFYQPLVYGFSFRNGSFSDVVDTHFERMFSREMPAIEEKILQEFALNEMVWAQDVAIMSRSIPQSKRWISKSDSTFYSRSNAGSEFISYYTQLGDQSAENNNYTDHKGGTLINPLYPKDLFIYKHGQVLTYDFVYDQLTASQLEELDQNGVVERTTFGFSGVYDNDYGATQDYAGKLRPYRNNPFDNSYARTVFNDYVYVEKVNKSTVRLTKTEPKGNIQRSKISVHNARISARAIETLVQAISRSFNGINIRYENNQTSINDSAIGYFHGGTVHLNTDRVQTDTLFHELTHPLLHVIKHVHPGLYAILTDEAKLMLEEGDLYALKVQAMYPELSGYDLLDEIVATMVGFNSVDAVGAFLAAQNEMNYRNVSQGIWNRMKALIDRFWSAVKYFFQGYDLNIDPRTTSIKDLSNQIVRKALRGENVLNISSGKMKEILAAAYDVPHFQLTAPAKNIYEVKNLFTNVATYNKDGIETPIPNYNTLDLDEKVSHLKLLLPSLNYEYYSNGVVYNFDERKPGHIPKDQWDKVIREQIMVGQDEKSIRLKQTILTWLNGSEHKITDLQAQLGRNNLGEYIYTEEALTEFLKGIHWTPTTKFYLYSDIWKNETLRPYYSEELIGYDPIVAVEFDHDDQMLVSFFNLTTNMLRIPELTTRSDRKNILGKYLTDTIAHARGIIDVTNTLGDVSNFMMGVAASKFVNAKGKKIHIGSVATVSLHPKRAIFETADSVILNNAAREMIKVDDFVKDLSPEMHAAIKSFALIKVGFSFERLLAKKYHDEDADILGVEDFYKGGMDVNDKRRFLLGRLKDINKLNIEHINNAAIQEIRLIIDTLSFLEEGKIMSDQISSKKDYSLLEQYVLAQFDANHPVVELIRDAVIRTSMRTVEQMKTFKTDINAFSEHFKRKYETQHGPVEKYFYEVGPKYFDHIIAHVVDDKGIKRNSGFILWTKDKNEDPMFYEQAQAISDDDLKMGRVFVDTVTKLLTEIYYHRRVSNKGDYIYDSVLGQKRKYTKEDALNGLLTETSYRKGMIPLMPDTVYGMMGKGKLVDSFIKHKKQIESGYIMFDEMAQMSDQDADFIDSMPDQFMQQFLHNQSADMLGSLGIKGKRMRNLLGLTEAGKLGGKIEYTYDIGDNRAAGLNTDLEILLEFLNMSTLRKINYENEVLPLVNGAKTYMLDTHTNQQFKQTNVIKYVELYTRQAIEGKRIKFDMSVAGINIDSTVQMAMSIASPIVMTLNFNVGIVSAVHNAMMAYTEGITNSLTGSHWAGAGDVGAASGLFFTDFHKVSQLTSQFQMVNSNDYEIVTHRYNQKRKKHIISDFTANWTNWASDMYARGIMMTAQMLRDGSYYAHTYDKDTGRAKYDPSKDKRFEIYFKKDEAHPEYKRQKALYEGLKRRLVADGVGLVNGEAAQGYSHVEMRALKTLADKYVVGAYGPLERNLMGGYLIGRMYMMFTTWLMTKIGNAVKKKSSIKDLGYYEIKEDDEGNLVPHWMREYTEGYMVTVFNMARRLIITGDTKQFSNMETYQKKNLIRFATTISLFLFFKLLYGMVVDDEDRERTGLMKYVPSFDIVPDWRMVRNISFATSSLLVFPTILEKTESPFAMMGILRRAFAKGLFGREISVDNLRYILPGYGGIHTLTEPFREE